jgi:GR25 family glycosyltransferase involved in LPS biosynthesis
MDDNNNIDYSLESEINISKSKSNSILSNATNLLESPDLENNILNNHLDDIIFMNTASDSKDRNTLGLKDNDLVSINKDSKLQNLNTPSLESSKNNKSLIIQLFDPYDDSKEYTITKESYTSTESHISVSSNDDKYNNLNVSDTLISNSTSSEDNNETKVIMKTVGTNTEKLVMTFKIPFNNSKVIEAEEINIPEFVNYKNKDFEKEKRLELEELKKTLIKRNKKEMQKMFYLLLDKYNMDIEEDFFKSSIGIPLDKKKSSTNDLSNTDDKTNLNSSDPYHMEYEIMNNTRRIYKNGKIIPEKNNLNSEEQRKYHENNISDSDDINSERETDIRSEHITSRAFGTQSLEKKDNFEERKKLRQERYIQRKKKKKHIINSYFDMVYVISMKEDNNKVDSLLNKLKENKVEYLLTNGINPKNIAYSKYINRWRYQLGDKNIKLTKQLFDYDIYIEKNPDLIKGKIINKSRAWNHWVQTGKNENRPLYEKSKIQNIAQVGCLLAHNKIIIDAMRKNYKNILILEDDVYFHKNFFNEIEDIMKNIPKKWDLLYLGAVQKDWTNINIKKNYYIAKNTYGAFAYGINSSVFEKIKKLCFELTEPFDKCLQKLHEYNNSYVLYPNIIITNIKNSKIYKSRDIIKYSKLFKWNIEDYDLHLYDQNKNSSETNN